jgi:hypothetical protein
VARLWSRSAPATISEADADPPLISTTSGLPFVMSAATRGKRWVSSAVRPRRRDDLAPVHEGARHRNRLVKQSAGIVAEVDDIARELVLRISFEMLDIAFFSPSVVCSLKRVILI